MKNNPIYNYPSVKDNNVRFLYNNADASNVKVIGSFSDWKPKINLSRQASGLWESDVLTFDNHNTVYEYKFLVDGSKYIIDPMNFYKRKGKYGLSSLLFVWENPSGFEKFLRNFNNELEHNRPQTSSFKKREQIIRQLDTYFNILSICRSVQLNMFFEKRILKALKEIKNEKIIDGIKIWLMYNHGFIVKTPVATFGIDIVTTECVWGLDWNISDSVKNELVDVLDFLLITHQHSDHSDEHLIKKMLDKKKNVFVLEQTAYLYDNRVSPFKYNKGFECMKQYIIPYKGIHVYDQGRNLKICYFQIFTDQDINIVHTGDHDYTTGLVYKSNIDCLIPKIGGVNPNYSVKNCFELIEKLDPKVIIPGHIVELAHPPGGGRGNYSQVLSGLLSYNIPAYVLMWGEQYHLIL